MIAHPMHPESARVLEDLGGDPAGFAARQLTTKIASGVDLVIAMTRAHRDAVLELAPRQLHRTFTLAEAALLVSEFGAQDVTGLAALRPQLRPGDAADIPDPIGQDPEVFNNVGAMIAELVPPVMELCRRSSATP
jgi:protein-tyrosine phosphatase